MTAPLRPPQPPRNAHSGPPPRIRVTAHDLYQHNEAVLLYRDGLISPREYLARTRRVCLAVIDEALLESVRWTLTWEAAWESGLLGRREAA